MEHGQYIKESLLPLVMRILLLASAYFAGGNAGLSVPYVGSSITLFWPPSGIALAALLLWGVSCWPGIFVGALVTNLFVGDLTSSVALAIAFGNTAGPMLGALLLQKVMGFQNDFMRGRDVTPFLLVGSGSMLLTASIGVFTLYAGGMLPFDLLSQAWIGWWLGDTVGVLVFTPLLLFLLNDWRTSVLQWPPIKLEFILVLGSCVCLAWLIFGGVPVISQRMLPLAFLVFPPLIWAGLRLSALETFAVVLVIASVAVIGTAKGAGPFSSGDLQLDQLILCIFIATITLIAFMMIGIQASQRKAEQQLHESESRLRLALQAANQGLYDLNVQTGETIVSPEYARMLGYEPHSFVETNASWLDRMHPRDREGVYQIYKEYIGGLRTDYQVEFRQLTQQGEWKWILSLGKVIEWDSEGHPVRMLGTHTDISDRKAKELALQQNEEALLRAQALAKLGSWRLDLENDVLTWSKETFRIFGVEDDRPLTYEGFLMCVVAEDRERVNLAWQAALQGESYDIEHRIDVRGQIKWLRERAELTRNRAGTPVEVLGTVEDISEHKRAEEEVNQARNLLRTVIDATPDWIFVKDRQHRFLLVNQALANSQGLKPDDMLGKPDTDFWPGSVCYGDPAHNIRGLHADDDAAFAGKRIHNPADQVMLATGQLRWFETVKLPLRNDNSGEITGIVGYAHDITQQRKVAEELSTALEELRVSERHQRELRVLAEREQSRMGALLSAMSIGILFEDNQQRVEYVNPAFLRMWGIGEHENLLNKPTRAILECSSERFAQLDHASKHVLNMPDTHETSERFELELNNGRTLTQLSYPVDDVEGRIIGRLWLYEDITLERQTAQQLLYLAERDPLTGLYNRHRFQEELNNLIAASLRSHQKFALLYFDLDDFKYINDTFGHRAGDTVLVRTAGEISSIVRHIEVFARLGGDEFAILSHLQPDDDLNILPARIVTSISSIPLHFRGTNIRLTTSVGVAIFPEHGETAEDLVAHADTAMYQAKNQGKNTWAIYDPQRDSSAAMMHRMTWYNRITQALEQNLFVIHFQGVYETARNTMTHLEILVRMRDVDEPGHLIMPGQFIPIAEKNGQIVNIDRWVIRRSIELLGENPVMPPVAINISGRTFDDPSIPQYIRSLLSELQVDPARLIIELTETAAVSDIQDAQRFIEAVHQAGCRVCLDDFGSGFSTFGYLKYLGVEILKIDGLFIRDLPNNRDNQIFVKAMVEVARGLGKLTVAEFVEDAATLSMVRSLGIDLAQGYYLGHPEAEIPVKS